MTKQDFFKALTLRIFTWMFQFFPGLLLVVAGIAKAEALFVGGDGSMYLTLPNSLSVPLVFAEILGGVGMLVYRQNVTLLYGATALFATFAGVSVSNIFRKQLGTHNFLASSRVWNCLILL